MQVDEARSKRQTVRQVVAAGCVACGMHSRFEISHELPKTPIEHAYLKECEHSDNIGEPPTVYCGRR